MVLGILFGLFGSSSAYAALFVIGGSLALAVVFARLSRAMPDGGPYHYVEKGVGTLPAFLVAWAYWISTLVTNAAIAVAAVAYASIFVPALSAYPLLGGAAAIGIVWLFTAISMLGA